MNEPEKRNPLSASTTFSNVLASPEVSEMEIRHFYCRGIQRMARAIFDLEVPIIAAINGHAIGAGGRWRLAAATRDRHVACG
jgi:enoyl-CoA hydratase/carnithine racemase